MRRALIPISNHPLQEEALVKTLVRFLCCAMIGLVVLSVGFAPRQAAAADEGFRSIFDGKTLDGWDGNPKFWRVEDGCIIGQTTKEEPTKGNTFCIWRGGKPADFELKAEFKLDNHNSGIQFRSWEPGDKWRVCGYQSDMDGSNTYTGILYGEGYRGILCMRGQKVVIGTDHKPKVVGTIGDSKQLAAFIKKGDWNEYHIVAKGNHMFHTINGQMMMDVTDEDTVARKDGIIAFQLHAGPPMKVQFRNIRIKEATKRDNPMKGEAKKKIVLIAGKPSHGYGSHEHNAAACCWPRRSTRTCPASRRSSSRMAGPPIPRPWMAPPASSSSPTAVEGIRP